MFVAQLFQHGAFVFQRRIASHTLTGPGSLPTSDAPPMSHLVPSKALAGTVDGDVFLSRIDRSGDGFERRRNLSGRARVPCNAKDIGAGGRNILPLAGRMR